MATGGGGTLEQICQLLDSADTIDDIREVILENLSSSKETWLIHLLVDHYFQTRSPNVQELFAEIKESQAKALLDKIQDGLRSEETRQPALQLVLFLAYREIPWCHQIVDTPLFSNILKIMKSETDVPVLMTSMMVIVILLPSLPVSIGPHLQSIFDIFGRVSCLCDKSPVPTPEVYLLYLQVALYSLFHRLYGMYPCSFMGFIRKFYSLKENIQVYEEIILPMIERVRLHPKLIMGQKENETSKNVWKNKETQDIIVACSRLSLDYIEGSWEDVHCPVYHTVQAVDKFKHLSLVWEKQNQRRLQRQKVPSRAVNIPGSADDQQSSEINLRKPSVCKVGESPSLLLGLSTPPGSERATPASSFLEPGPQPGVEGATGDSTSGQLTPCQADEGEKTPLSRSSSRGAFQASKSVSDPKKPAHRPLATPGTPGSISHNLPWMSPAVATGVGSGNVGLTEASPFRSKVSAFEQPSRSSAMRSLCFTASGREVQEEEQGEKAVPAITLQSSTEELEDKAMLTPVSQATPIEAASTSLTDADTQLNNTHSVLAQMAKQSTAGKSSDVSGSGVPYDVAEDGEFQSATKDVENSQQICGSHQKQTLDVLTEVVDKLASDTANVDQEVEEINERDDQFDESAALNSSSSTATSQTEITAESVRQFMKRVNRIRFNSLTSNSSSNSEADSLSFVYHFGATKEYPHRPRSCPPFRRMGPPVPGQECLSPPKRTQNKKGNNSHGSNGRGRKMASADRSSWQGGQQKIKRTPLVTQASVQGDVKDVSDIPLSEDSTDEVIPSVSLGDTPEKSCPFSHEADQCPTEIVIGLPKHINAVFQCILAPSKLAVCCSCNKSLVVTSDNPNTAEQTLSNKEVSLFSTMTPPELLDRHLRLGSELHAKELTKIPLTSKETTNWTHFGGRKQGKFTMLEIQHDALNWEPQGDSFISRLCSFLEYLGRSLPPADEVSILRGQILLMQTQIMYERHKRINHAKRNRRLLRRMTNIANLEEQQRSLVSQMELMEEEIQHLSVSVKLLEDDNRTLRQIQESDEYEKLVQFRTSLIENKDLKAASVVLKNLLLTQREDYDKQQKKLENVQHKHLESERELRICKERLALTDKLKHQVLQLQNEVLLTQEFHQKCQEKLRYGSSMSRHHAEESYLSNALKAEIRVLKEENKKCSNLRDAYEARLEELERLLKDKDVIITELKKKLDESGISYNSQLKAAEERCASLVHVNFNLENEVMELTGEINKALYEKKAAAWRAVKPSAAKMVNTVGSDGSSRSSSSQGLGQSISFDDTHKEAGTGKDGDKTRQGGDGLASEQDYKDRSEESKEHKDKTQVALEPQIVLMGSVGTLRDSGVVEENEQASPSNDGSEATGSSLNTGDSACWPKE